MFTMRKMICVLAATFVVLAATRPAAASLTDVLNLFAPGQNELQDSSADLLINGQPGQGTTGGTASTIVQQGSVLLSTFEFTSITNAKGAPSLGNGTNYTEVDGLIALQCSSATQVTGSAGTTWDYVFGPATSATDRAAIGVYSPSASAAVSGWATGTMVGMYDLTTTYSRLGPSGSASIDADVQSAITTGVQLWQFGFTGASGAAATGQGWEAYSPANDISLIGNGSNSGTVNFALNQTAVTPYSSFIKADQTTNAFATVFTGNGSVNTIALDGNSTLLATSGQTPFQAFDNATVYLDAIPEPASLAVWLGVCVVGGVVVWRRRRRS